jgi:hypothetical protein
MNFIILVDSSVEINIRSERLITLFTATSMRISIRMKKTQEFKFTRRTDDQQRSEEKDIHLTVSRETDQMVLTESDILQGVFLQLTRKRLVVAQP